jgi:hypothetical protein
VTFPAIAGSAGQAGSADVGGAGNSGATDSGGTPAIGVSGTEAFGGTNTVAGTGPALATCVDEPEVAEPPPVTGAITERFKSDGCSKPYPCSSGQRTLHTEGTKDADCADKLADGTPVCGAWSYDREYSVFLPAGYDESKAYTLVIQAPGCGGGSADVPRLDNNAMGTLIRVGISPPPVGVGHATNPGQRCFDDHEGDDSVDWELYERLYDKLNSELCFDRRRVFVSGYHSGATIASELGCKYAGDSRRPIRGVLVNSGQWPDAAQLPTCTQAPLAGIWMQAAMDVYLSFDNTRRAVGRAMQVDQCAAPGYDDAPRTDFPIGGGNPDDTCRQLAGCNPLAPLVVCPLAGQGRGSFDSIANPGFAAFTKLFQTGPLQP